MTSPNTQLTSTAETTPFIIWKHEVECEAVRLGADVASVRESHRARIIRAYQAGEPVWMVAAELRDVAFAFAKTKRTQDGSHSLIRAANRSQRK